MFLWIVTLLTYISISTSIHINFDLNVKNNANAEYNKKRMYEFLFLLSFVHEKITVHYREMSRCSAKTICMCNALVSAPNKGLCYTAKLLCSFCRATKQVIFFFVWIIVIVDELTNCAISLWKKNPKTKRGSVYGSNEWTDQNRYANYVSNVDILDKHRPYTVCIYNSSISQCRAMGEIAWPLPYWLRIRVRLITWITVLSILYNSYLRPLNKLHSHFNLLVISISTLKTLLFCQ